MAASDSYLQGLYAATGAKSVRKHGLVTRERLRGATTVAEVIADLAICMAVIWVACYLQGHI